MLVTLWLIMPSFVRVGDIFQTTTVLEAHNKGVETGPMVMLLFWVGVIEIISIPALQSLNTFDQDAGDYAFDPLNLSKACGAVLNKYKTAELKNGCLAMMASSGMITHWAHGLPLPVEPCGAEEILLDGCLVQRMDKWKWEEPPCDARIACSTCSTL